MQNTVVAHVKPPPVLDPVSTTTAISHLWWNGLIKALPSIAAAIVLLIAAWIVGRIVTGLMRRMFDKRGHTDLGSVIGAIVFGVIMIAAVLIAAVIVFPSVKPATIISSLGIGSVAIGFAFKDILQNLLAGILLLINRPYRRGDQIKVKEFEGTVEHIQSRATLIKTYDGRRVIIPNSDVYTSPVIVNTAFPTRRDMLNIGIGYGDEPGRAIAIFTDALAKVEGIETDPAPDVVAWGLDASTVTLRARWWSKSTRRDRVMLRARVIVAVWQAAADNAIDLPFPTQQILFHDQTEDSDGDRRAQREGWPAGDDPPPARRSTPPPVSA